MELWNKKDLRAPPNNSVKMKCEDLNIIHLKKTLNGAVGILERKRILYKEAALLSRYIYRAKRRLRGHKSLMFLEKINRGLRRYLSLNLEHVYRNFYMMITQEEDDLYNELVYLPTKQMLQHLLVRTQGFSKLMYFLATSCQSAAFFHREILIKGHLVHENLLCLGIVSRIWCFARYYIICACQWYSQLFPYLEKLQILGVRWLPAEYEFSDDLKRWLEPDRLLGELSYDANVQKISKEISEIKEFVKDTGVLVNRKQFLAGKNIKTKTPLGGNKSSSLSVSRNGKTSVTAVDPKLNYYNYFVKSSENNELIEVEPLQSVPSYLGVMISREDIFSQKMGIGSSPVMSNVELSGSVSDLKKTKVQQTSLNTAQESENVKLFMSTMQELCESSNKETNDSRESVLKELLPSSRTKRMYDSEANSEVNDFATFSLMKDDLSSVKSVEDTPSVLRNSYQMKLKDTHHSDLVTKSNSDIEEFSADYEENVSNTKKLAKKQNKSLDSRKIVNGIKTVNDLKTFLQREKKARAKGKNCIFSELGKSEWNVLIDSINKIVKKKTSLKTKQSKTNKLLMEEIRGTLTSFLV